MKLVAMMIVRNEVDRYLRVCLDSLLGFCDEIRILDDASEDAFREIDWLGERVQIQRNSEPQFFEHEGYARQALLDWTMEGNPTHILAIDADEIVGDGQALRRALEEGSATGVTKLSMTEIWGADEDYLFVRTDGDWRPRPIGIAFAVPEDWWTNRQIRRHFRIRPEALACGRTPAWITMAGNRTTTEAVSDILHFGWACEADRDARYQRYVVHDGGQFHKNKHLESIMWGDDRVKLARIPWWPDLDKDVLLERVNRA